MSRLRSIKIKDFQAHADKTVVLDKNITSIVGASDRGKSAILRALRWACLNDFVGDEFIKKGAKQAKVMVTFSDGTKIIRSKSGRTSGNAYKIVKGEKKETFKSFKNTVPAPIADVLQMNVINFQAQHDAPFWFDETPGEVSRRLNAVIDLSVIDTTMSNIANAVRRSQERISLSEEHLEKELAEYSRLKEQKGRIEDFQNLTYLRKERDKNKEDVESFSELIALILETKGMKLTATPPPIDNINAMFDTWQNMEKDISHFAGFLAQIERAIESKRCANKNAAEAEEEFHKETKGKICPLCQNRLS